MTSSNVWVAISGAMNETKQIAVPKETLEFIFHVRDYKWNSLNCNTLLFDNFSV